MFLVKVRFQLRQNWHSGNAISAWSRRFRQNHTDSRLAGSRRRGDRSNKTWSLTYRQRAQGLSLGAAPLINFLLVSGWRKALSWLYVPIVLNTSKVVAVEADSAGFSGVPAPKPVGLVKQNQ